MEALGDSEEQPPADAMACVAQVPRGLLTKKQRHSGVNGCQE